MIPLRYAIFALVSMLLNLTTQKICFTFYDGNFSLHIAIFFGTLIGLLSKYILDKKYIFFYSSTDKINDLSKFMLYSLMGGFTTSIFWLFEFTFDAIFGKPSAKYIGAIIGLTIGYTVKFYLDRTFVFRAET